MKPSDFTTAFLSGAILIACQLGVGQAAEQAVPAGDAKAGSRKQAAESSRSTALLRVTFAVVDSRTGKPVTEFECRE
jgi:hypothetical protein